MDKEGAAPLLLTVTEVAAALNVSRTTVYQLITSGQLHAIRVGARCRRVSREELTAYITRQTLEAA